MTDQPKWVVVRSCRAVYEAEVAAATLEAAGITARVDVGDSVGVFGPGYQGAVTGGVRVLVPASDAAEARAVLGESSDADD